MNGFQVDKNTYATDVRFQALRDANVSYEDFSANQSFYLRQLSTTSIMDLYNKGKNDFVKYSNLYKQSYSLFTQLHEEKDRNYKKYQELLQTYANNSKTGETTIADRSKAAGESGYTTDLIRNTTDAEIMANVYLSSMGNAVNTQRHGLMG